MSIFKNLSQNKYIGFVLRKIINFYEINKRIFLNTNNKLKLQYIDWLIEDRKTKSNEYISLSNDNYKNNNSIKLIAFYLTQYHENEINNKYFGKGFMEWYNVTKCIPQFKGHYQPHLPIDVGFYDLSNDDIMYRQIELAKQYGIYGFCFYYYWFSGDKLLEKPLENFLNNKELDIPFFLFWANETWTCLWDNGDNKKIIKKQELKDDDSEKFCNDIIKYFKDDRYIKIDNKPLLIIYKWSIFEKEKFKNFLEFLTKYTISEGFDGLYIIWNDDAIGNINIKEYSGDAIVEFSNRQLQRGLQLLNLSRNFVIPSFKGQVFDIKKSLEKNLHLSENKDKTFKTVCCGWDNSPRKAFSNATIFSMTPKDYKKWLKDVILWTKKKYKKDEQFVFINAWNEWAEGAHLEPDQHYGYAYLQATKEALEETSTI